MSNPEYIQGRGYIVDNNKFILSWFTDNKRLHYCGTHKGEIVSNRLTIELYDTIEEIIVRVKEVGIILTLEQAKEIMNRASIRGVTLSDEIKQEILDYVNSLTEE